MTQPSRRRRRILQGLSAVSVASALPAFAFTSRGAAQFEQFEHEALKPRVELLSQRGAQLELAFHVQSATAQRVMRVYQIIASFVEYEDGRTQNLVARLPQPEGSFIVRRLPPPTPNIMVSAGGEVELGQFAATLESTRGRRAMAHFRIRVGPQILQPAAIAVSA
ncbi:MAG: hypothetical protein ACI9KE_001271 [Polyangiales bacterium]|jgi:hypothetical protein